MPLRIWVVQITMLLDQNLNLPTIETQRHGPDHFYQRPQYKFKRYKSELQQWALCPQGSHCLEGHTV